VAKLIHKKHIGGPKFIKRFYEECELMASFDHPNITKFLGVCSMPNYKLPALVMEKLNGNLDDLLRNYKDPNLPTKLKLSVLNDVAKGLHCLHEAKTIHRDLTVRNILLTSRMVAKITDFGVSRIIDEGSVISDSSIHGGIAYLPPEAALEVISTHRPGRAVHYGPSLDIFSFGHLALATLTQVRPECVLMWLRA
jgi:serine/threonine protein kinase